MGLVSPNQDPDAINSADVLAQEITTLSQINVRSFVYPDYQALLDALHEEEIQFAWLPPFTYLVAHNRGLGELSLLTNHFGVYQYGFQILAHVDSQFNVYYDPQANRNFADTQTALLQFQERQPCWVDPQSASGYVAPLGILAPLGVTLKPGVFAQSHTAVIRALYIKEVCDFGVTYTTYGDPRTAATILDDLPDTLTKIVVVWQSNPDIPNLALSFTPDVPPDLRLGISNALVNYAKTPEGQQTLTTANAYEIAGLKMFDDQVFDPLRTLVDASGIKLKDLIGK